jgi:hypothetical protein
LFIYTAPPEAVNERASSLGKLDEKSVMEGKTREMSKLKDLVERR